VTGNTTLFCRPEAAPYPVIDDIVWFKNGALLNPGIDESSRVRKMPNGNLFMHNILSSDGGTYRCDVSNALGKASTQGNLTVLGKEKHHSFM